ncbi:MAG: BREX system Lon protease-like protein BrxL, partial [Planctomycetaceae bacterium]|nr:BREX system Lon protease-like protein BrxL [Planctomycetaceae bacterium]
YLKLFFPHWTKPEYVQGNEFQAYCLRHAFEMRRIIRQQLSILDPNEYAGKIFTEIKLKKL